MGMGTSPCAASGKWRNRRLKDVDRPSIGHSNCLSAPCRRGPRSRRCAGGGKIGHGDALGPSRQSFGASAGAVEGEAASRSTSQRRAAASKTLGPRPQDARSASDSGAGEEGRSALPAPPLDRFDRACSVHRNGGRTAPALVALAGRHRHGSAGLDRANEAGLDREPW